MRIRGGRVEGFGTVFILKKYPLKYKGRVEVGRVTKIYVFQIEVNKKLNQLVDIN